ncbi:MAG: AzlC family ABC transporter permease [Paludibacteraceae bacterium]|nr:AzlC family ABC transporter permease [Paludibacteraceae bacterium]
MSGDLKQAFRLSLPVLGAFWFLGISYGMLASSMGYSIWIPLSMAITVFSGSVEFIALTMLVGAFNPVAALTMALMVGARHIFYGISMLDKWRNAGWKKPFLIFWMCDESFAINYSQGGSFRQQLTLSFLNYSYWVTGGIMGYFLGECISDDMMHYLKGLDFVVVAMFVSIFMDDFLRNKGRHGSAWLGVLASAVCLVAFGPAQFIVPTMLVILTVLYFKYRRQDL